MRRISGQDASFLYTETPTVLMHTLKIQIFESNYGDSDYPLLHSWLESALHTVPMLRQRVMFVPGNLHHPVMVDDPDFDLESHIYRAALPAPGGKAEFDQMISQILCHRLDRQRPMWELWALTGLEGGRVAIVHKIHHCLADGVATVRYLDRVFQRYAGREQREMTAPTWRPHPLPSARKLVWQALVDHARYPAGLSCDPVARHPQPAALQPGSWLSDDGNYGPPAAENPFQSHAVGQAQFYHPAVFPGRCKSLG